LEVLSDYGSLLVLVGELERHCWAGLGIGAPGLVVGLLAAITPLAPVAGDAVLAASPGAAFALRVAVAALVEVRAAHLLGEDVDHVLLLAVVGTGGGQALREVAASVV